MKKLLFALVSIFCLTAIFGLTATAQDTTVVTPGTGGFGKVIYWIGGAIALYEVVARYVPTISSVSIVTWAMRLFKAIVPDRSTGTKPHE
jgi:TRAP-type uncharacterized transport system substrate-binding protein